VADENNTEKTDETAAETPVEEKPKRTRKKAEPEAAAPEAAEAKPKRTRKKAGDAPEEPAAAEPVAEEAELEPEPASEPVAEEAPAQEPASEEPVAEEPVAEEQAEDAQPVEEPVTADQAEDESVAEGAAAGEPATDEAAEQPSQTETAPTTRGPKPKKKRLPRSQRRKHARPLREQPAQRKPITRLPKPEHERGRDQQRRGVVVSAAMDKTIVVRVDSIKAHPKYKKVIRRSKKFHAHDEQNQAKAGDVVRIVETRPLSKTKNWRLAEIVEVAQ
jgi:small subunit ribosomal protein S17